MARFKQGDIAVDLKTGQQFDVADGDIELDPSKYGRMETGTKATPQEVLSAKPQQAETLPSNKPRFPTVEKAIQEFTGPALTAAAGFIPGSLPIQAGIGGGTELVSELAKGETPSLSKIGIAAATPIVTRGAGSLLKSSARGAARIFGKQNLVEGGIQKAEQALGKEASGLESSAALEAAKGVTTPVAQTETGKVVSDLLSKQGRIAGIDPATIATTEELVRNAANAAKTGNPIRYNELFESATNMSKLAQKAKGHDKEAFINLRQAMLSDLEKIGPEAKNATIAYRKKASIDDIAEAMRGANPAKKVADTIADPLLKGVFNETQKHTLSTIANQIGGPGLFKIAGSLAGLGILGYNHPTAAAEAILAPAIMGALVAAPKVGPIFARSLIGPEGTINKAALPALAQMVRGYLAEQE